MDLNFSTENTDSVSHGETLTIWFGHNRSDLHNNTAFTLLKPAKVEYHIFKTAASVPLLNIEVNATTCFPLISATQRTNRNLNGVVGHVCVFVCAHISCV